MKVLIKGFNFGRHGMTKVFSEKINISANNDMYNKKYIIEKILEAQKADGENSIKREIISLEKWEENISKHEDAFGLIDMIDLSLCADDYVFSKGKDANVDMINVEIRPETKEDFNIYFEKYLLKAYHLNLKESKIRNFILSLPYDIDLFNKNTIIEVGDYIVIDVTKYVFYHFDSSYIIHKDSLSLPVIDIMAPESLIPYLIGKGGKHINCIKDDINNKYKSNIRRINLVSYDK